MMNYISVADIISILEQKHRQKFCVKSSYLNRLVKDLNLLIIRELALLVRITFKLSSRAVLGSITLRGKLFIKMILYGQKG